VLPRPRPNAPCAGPEVDGPKRGGGRAPAAGGAGLRCGVDMLTAPRLCVQTLELAASVGGAQKASLEAMQSAAAASTTAQVCKQYMLCAVKVSSKCFRHLRFHFAALELHSVV
jgi:hypothetical protein